MIDTDFITIGHRGAAGLAPENTLAGIRAALERGVRYIEVDVQRSRDGALVLLHDLRLNRTTNGKGRLRDMSWPDLQALDAGRYFSADFVGEPLPLLGEALGLVKAAGATLILEVKSPKLYPGIGADIDRIIRAAEAAEHVIIMSFDIAFMGQIAATTPPYPLGGLYLWPPSVAPGYLRCISVYWRFGFIFAGRLARTRAQGLRTWAWTVNRAADKERVKSMGFQGLVTDFP